MALSMVSAYPSNEPSGSAAPLRGSQTYLRYFGSPRRTRRTLVAVAGLAGDHVVGVNGAVHVPPVVGQVPIDGLQGVDVHLVVQQAVGIGGGEHAIQHALDHRTIALGAGASRADARARTTWPGRQSFHCRGRAAEPPLAREGLEVPLVAWNPPLPGRTSSTYASPIRRAQSRNRRSPVIVAMRTSAWR